MANTSPEHATETAATALLAERTTSEAVTCHCGCTGPRAHAQTDEPPAGERAPCREGPGAAVSSDGEDPAKARSPIEALEKEEGDQAYGLPWPEIERPVSSAGCDPATPPDFTSTGRFDAVPMSEADVLSALLSPSDPHTTATGFAAEPTAASVYDCLVKGGESRARATGDFGVIAGPGAPIGDGPRAGDIWIERALGEGALARLSVITDVLAEDAGTDRPRVERQGTRSFVMHVTDVPGSKKGAPNPCLRRLPSIGNRLATGNLLLRPRAPLTLAAPLSNAATTLVIEDAELHWPDNTEPASAAILEATQAEIDKSNIRWLQNALNKILGKKLAVDGDFGRHTRAALLEYQGQRALDISGIADTPTRQAIREDLDRLAAGAPAAPASSVSSATAAPGRFPCGPSVGDRSKCALLGHPEELKGFAQGDHRLTSEHHQQLITIARCVLARLVAGEKVDPIRIVGHASDEGAPTANVELGMRRAGEVRRRLIERLNTMCPGATGADGRSGFITILDPETRGSAEAIAGDRVRSRRVHVYVPRAPVVPPRRRKKRRAAPLLNPARWAGIMSGPDLRIGNFVNVLVDGTSTYRAMYHAILTAAGEGHYVYLLGWWLDDDVPLGPPLPVPTLPPPARVPPRPGHVRNLFAEASGRGVQIRAMLWHQKLPVGKNSAEVRRINALANGAAILDNHTLTFGSQHQKVLVVKGESGLIAFCGGLDINWDRVTRSSAGRGSPQHDVHCRVVGPAAHDLLATFIRRWDAHPGHGVIDRGTKGDLLGRREPRPAPLPPQPIGRSGGNCAVRITRTYNPVLPLAPRTTAVRERTVRETLIAAIANARRFIYMEDQYLVNMEAAGVLNAALSHIEHLTILIADSRISDLPRVWEGRLNFIDRLKRGAHGHKARVFFLATPPESRETPASCEPPTFGPHTYVHAKTWIVDDELAIIGSANCNQRGWTHDSEVNAVIFEAKNPEDKPFAQRVRMRLWMEHLNVPAASVEDGVAALSLWLRRPPGARICPYDPRAGTSRCAPSSPLDCAPWTTIDPAGPP